MRGLAGCLFAAALMSPGSALAQGAGEPVKIGILHDASGPYRDNQGPGDEVAVDLAIKDFGGKVLGRPIEAIFADHGNKPDIGSSIARRWYDTEKVNAIFGIGHSAVALAVQQLTADKNKIDVTVAASSSDLIGKACSRNAFQWVHDTYSLAASVARALTLEGGKSWYFVTVDYAFGHALERDARKVVVQNGGTVVGALRHPMFMPDLSSYLLQAKASGAQVIGLSNAGVDTVNSIKQGAEFGLGQGGQRIASLLMVDTDVRAAGLQAAQGLAVALPFYWDRDDASRAFSKRYWERMNRPPTMYHAGMYSAVTHYLKAVQAVGTDDTAAVLKRMRELPVSDFMGEARIREDGKVMRDMYVFRVKAPAESKGDWDLLKQMSVVPADEAALPLSESECPYIRQPKAD